MTTITRSDRIADVAALLLIIAGVALYLDGTSRLRDIGEFSYRRPGARGVSALHTADLARRTANGGIGLAIGGCVAGVASAVRAARRRPVS